jgi:hypothetical protein
MLVRKSWATPRYAADKGLLLRDTECEIAAARRICLLLERARGDRSRYSREGVARDLVKHGGGSRHNEGLATGES